MLACTDQIVAVGAATGSAAVDGWVTGVFRGFVGVFFGDWGGAANTEGADLSSGAVSVQVTRGEAGLIYTDLIRAACLLFATGVFGACVHGAKEPEGQACI